MNCKTETQQTCSRILNLTLILLLNYFDVSFKKNQKKKTGGLNFPNKSLNSKNIENSNY